MLFEWYIVRTLGMVIISIGGLSWFNGAYYDYCRFVIWLASLRLVIVVFVRLLLGLVNAVCVFDYWLVVVDD